MKAITGQTYLLQVQHTNTIANVKEAIKDEYSIPYEIQLFQLLFAGKILSNEMTLSEYNIQKESTLHLIFQLHPKPSDDENDSSDEDLYGPKYPETFVFIVSL